MDYYTTEEIAEKWGISKRRVQRLVQDGRIEGAVRQCFVKVGNALKIR